MIRMSISGPEHAEQEMVFDQNCTIGRAQDNQLRINDVAVSAHHAMLLQEGDRLVVQDLESTNGTIVNDKQIDRETELYIGSEIRIGETSLTILEIAPPVEDESQYHLSEQPEEQTQSIKPASVAAHDYSPFRFLKPFLEPLQTYLDDDSVSEIMINGPEQIFIERAGKIEKVPETFNSHKALVAAAKNIGRAIEREVNEQRPIMDARLEDGSRVCVVLAPCSLDGAAVAIRKFFKKKLSMQRLIDFGSVTQDMVEFVDTAVQLKKNIIVSGGTGSGKTSLLNAVSSMIPNHERIVVIEDSAELQLQKDHQVRLEARPPDDKGRYGVSIRDLLRATLRLRPDRIVIGEIRGGESFDLLQAMNTGHGGSMSTIHSNSPMDTLLRLENTAMQSDVDVPPFSIKQQIANTINLVVHTSRYRDGSRKISHISEVLGLDNAGNYKVQNLFTFKVRSEPGGKVGGIHEQSAIPPTFMEEIIDYGLPMPACLTKFVK